MGLSLRRLALGGLLVAVVAGGYVYLQGDMNTAKPRAKRVTPPAPVLVAHVTTRTIPVTIQTLGTMQARSTVSVRSRVDGQIMQTDFTEGQLVHKGDVLFRIDPRPFQAKLREALAMLSREQASLEKAKSDFQRYQSLSNKGFSSQQKYEEARAAMNGLNASIRASQAAIDLAQLNLEFATVKAPITGRTGSVLIQAGNLVKADGSNPLVVINEIDPILCALSIPENHLAEIKRRMAAGSLSVLATIPESRRPAIRGRIVFINNAVDTETGTILLKAQFANKDGFLTPGQFVRVTIEMDAIRNARVVPERAVQEGQAGAYVFVVAKDNSVTPVSVTPGPSNDGYTVIGDALKVGDTVVTDGQLRLFKGAKVHINGVVDADGPVSKPMEKPNAPAAKPKAMGGKPTAAVAPARRSEETATEKGADEKVKG